MSKISKTIISALLTVLLAVLPLCAFSVSAEDVPEITVIAEGNCGVMDENNNPTDNATYTITSDGVMTVRGSGSMADFTTIPNSQSWKAYKDLITGLVIEQGITRIGDKCFWLFRNIAEVSLPDTLQVIAEQAFYDCSGIHSVNLPDGLRSIGNSAFRECYELYSVVIPDSVVSFGENVFKDCENLHSAVLPSGLTVIPEETFFGCRLLRAVTIPGSVTMIDKRAFYNCEALTDVYYLAPLAKWGTIEISDSPYMPSLSTESGNKVLDRATIHSHFVGGGTSGVSRENVISQPDCVTPAGYDNVERCNITGCGCEIARTRVVTAPATGIHTPLPKVSENKTDPTCVLPGGRDEVVYCEVCGGELSRTHVTIAPLDHPDAYTVAESAPTATEHGYTQGDYCPDCGTWLSGHEVIHNTLGERTYLDEYTEDGEQTVIIKCTVCGGEGLYAIEPVPSDEEPGQETNKDDSPFSGIRKAIRSIIDFFLRLLKWFSDARS